jgi:hypothetical protein
VLIFDPQGPRRRFGLVHSVTANAVRTSAIGL